MNTDELFTHALESLKAARRSVDDLNDELEARGLSDKYLDVQDVRKSILAAQSELELMAVKWTDEANESSLRGEGLVPDDFRMPPKAYLIERDDRTLEELAKSTELEFDKFFFPGSEEEE